MVGARSLFTTRSCLLNPNRNPLRSGKDRQRMIETDFSCAALHGSRRSEILLVFLVPLWIAGFSWRNLQTILLFELSGSATKANDPLV